MAANSPLLPLFDSLEYIKKQTLSSSLYPEYNQNDIEKALNFLKCYTGSQGTFNSYRREIERLLHWCTLAVKKSLSEIKREDIETFVVFCQNPPKNWIGISKLPRFIIKESKRIPNAKWRPFVVTLSKVQHRKGQQPEIKNFELSQGALRELFAILSSFFNYLLQEEYIKANPIALIRQKSKFIRKMQGQPKIRRLSELQWYYVINTAAILADKNPEIHERTLFISSILYSMYLRISELTASPRWIPKMNDFFRDSDGDWWFMTVGKGNKQRQIAVSEAMLEALKRWRKHLNLSPLPSPADNSPLLPRIKGKGPIQSTNSIRKIVQYCFDQAVYQLKENSFEEEAEALLEATVHWLRHTGISEDVKIRPREHVRDDAGHSSGAITDKYVDIELRERHQSAKKKLIY
ncbi:tyrosine-type recombinase/integrase [Coxiella-like endosymbiont]|uniref:tyrosine-type recombinase/integrase n=1 Tax=Coxiella-like endosymbiont TaxID=1592897 RepID=UPI00272C8A8C|nr:tyrosine-type recombinase/integrase [Coxiella-like endosymbiont]